MESKSARMVSAALFIVALLAVWFFVNVFVSRMSADSDFKESPYVLVFEETMPAGANINWGRGRRAVVRVAKDHELAEYRANPDRFVPAIPDLVYGRTVARHVSADTPLMKEDFEDFWCLKGLSPGGSGDPLDPGMHAVELRLSKRQSEQGRILRGQYVYVLLTANVPAEDNTKPPTRTTVMLANREKVMSRSWSWLDGFSPSIGVTLQSNPYRAALIEAAKSRGAIHLVPAPSFRRGKAVISEGKDEEQRIVDLLHGWADLNRDLDELLKDDSR